MRDEKRTGIKIVSLEDGSVITKMPELHKKSIYNVLVSNDYKTLITAGKDKVVKATDLASQQNLLEHFGHGDAVTAITFSSDERYLFTADRKRTIFVYHTGTWQKICRIPTNFDFEIDNLMISQDNTVLLCSEKAG